ncbi:hypothetical protein COP2_028370 [Malus domestica]
MYSCVVYLLEQVPVEAEAAAAVAGLPPHQRFSLSSSSEELSSIYGSRHLGQKVLEIEEKFYEELLLYNYVMTSLVSTSWTWGCVIFLFPESSNPIDATSRRGAVRSPKLSNFARPLIEWHVVFQTFATTLVLAKFLGYNLNRQDAKRGGNHHGALHPKKMLKSRIGGKQLRGTYHLLTGSSSSFFTYELFGSKESSTSGISGPYICAFVQGFGIIPPF